MKNERLFGPKCTKFTWGNRQVTTLHMWIMQGIYRNLSDRKSISLNISHLQSLNLQAILTDETLESWNNSRESKQTQDLNWINLNTSCCDNSKLENIFSQIIKFIGTSNLTDANYHGARQQTNLSLKQNSVWFQASAGCVSKTADRFLAYPTFNISMHRFESSQEDESRAQSAGSSKAYRKPRVFNWGNFMAVLMPCWKPF